MDLSEADKASLRVFNRRETVLKRIIPVVAIGDVIAAITLLVSLGPAEEITWLTAGAFVVCSVLALLFLMRGTKIGEGSAASVLAGRPPVATAPTTVVDDPHQESTLISFKLEDRSDAAYLHVLQGPDWAPKANERYTAYGFGRSEEPFLGAVMFIKDGESKRHWQHRMRPSPTKYYKLAQQSVFLRRS